MERISALIADLDFSPGKCGDIDTANAIIDDLSKILGAQPAAITHSGGGLHPYWAISNGYSVVYGLAALLKRWRRLVEVAETHGAHVDNVFDLARVLRVPGTLNNKSASNGHGPIPVVCCRGSGVALTLADVDKRLLAYGIREILDFPEETEFKSDPSTWEFADETCSYAAAMIDGWAEDAQPNGLELGKARHHWFLSQAVRIGCARRLECVTESDYEHAKIVLTKSLIHLCNTRTPVRKVPPGEITDGFKYGTEKAATKTEDEAREELGGHLHDDNPKDKDRGPIFREFGPTEWAKPVEPTRFFIKQALCVDTWGVNGGPEKSLKTHDNLALAMSVATGINLYRSDLFPVLRQGKALLIIGEGGEKQILRLLHRMCRAYGIQPEDVAKDPAFPLWVEFGAAPLNSDRLRDEIKQMLDRHQPDYVSMESFYNFHPAEVSAANLYERGQVIDAYHKLVRDGGTDVVSILTDHNKKGANELGLRHISMSGQAENSDSWIQRIHRREPNVASGEFCLTSFNSRNWGGSTFDVDWHLGPFDHDQGCHTGDISWDVCPHKVDANANGTDSGVKIDIAILIRDNPWKFNRQQIFEELRPVRKQDVYAAIKKMVDEGELNEESPKLHGHGGKAVVIGPGAALAAFIGKVVAHGGGRTP